MSDMIESVRTVGPKGPRRSVFRTFDAGGVRAISPGSSEYRPSGIGPSEHPGYPSPSEPSIRPGASRISSPMAYAKFDHNVDRVHWILHRWAKALFRG